MRIKTLLAAVLSCALLVPAAFAQTGAKPAATPTPKATVKMGTKKMPARDPKTGRFIKTTKGTSKGMKMGAMKGKKGGAMTGTKKMPPRDPKTGRFVKKGATPATPATPASAKKP